ncbi:hypothetical protein [Mangrovicella endophytica]|uniref:hypothetical protein n=1 Tax=Mangrovicella endophytica TaxID=2066697 RepID=UPI0018E4D6D6|nr:hypothetical protein [Mangrovicella endophytica]
MTVVQQSNSRPPRTVGYWGTLAVAVVILAFGIPIFLGGIWLALLGGSWYYVFAGLGLLLTAIYLFRFSMTAVSIYAITFVGTLIWAFWEAGFDWWAQVPRLVAPTVVLVLVLLTIPVLRRHRRQAPGAAPASSPYPDERVRRAA